jgi:LuxR family maltose regulon positive regulatory protein
MIEARTAEATIQQSRGDLDNALGALEEALSLGEAECYTRTYLDRGAPMARLLRHAAARGIKPDYTGRLLSAFGPLGRPRSQPLIEPLSARELEVLQLIAQGLSNREICDRLFVALSTVKGHNRNIYGKLGVKRRTEAIARGRDLGLL